MRYQTRQILYCNKDSGITSTRSQLAGHDRRLIHSLVPYLPGLMRVESQQLSATISLVEIVAEYFINTDM